LYCTIYVDKMRCLADYSLYCFWKGGEEACVMYCLVFLGKGPD
jgi:hypothetical protein